MIYTLRFESESDFNFNETYTDLEKAKRSLEVYIGACDAFGFKIKTASLKAEGHREGYMIKNGIRYQNWVG